MKSDDYIYMYKLIKWIKVFIIQNAVTYISCNSDEWLHSLHKLQQNYRILVRFISVVHINKMDTVTESDTDRLENLNIIQTM